MTTDYRELFLSDIKERLTYIFSESEIIQRVSSEIIMALDNYDLLERQTEITVYDNRTEKCLKRYYACLRVDGKSEKTIAAYWLELERFFKITQKQFDEVGSYDIRFYIANEQSRGISNRTAENKRSIIAAFYQWTIKEEILEKNPCLRIAPIKYVDEVREPFSTIDIDKIRSHCNTVRDRAIVEFLLSTGVRINEIATMNVEDVDLKNLTVLVKHGKGGKQRLTYMNPLCAEHLERYFKTRTDLNGALFISRNGTPLKIAGFRNMLSNIEKESGVVNIHPHRFRRTCATTLASRGMDVQAVQKILGHSNIQTTMHYITLDKEYVVNAYKRYSN